MPLRANDRIQRSKLIAPSLGVWELARPRLLDRLSEGRSAPLSIICGMAGSGKTTLSRQWISRLDDYVAWITLDESDDDLPRFVQLLIAAVDTIAPGFGAATLADLAFNDSMAAEAHAATFSDELTVTGLPIVIVLDDFHLIGESGILDFLDWVVRFPPPGLHLCLVGRTDPGLPLVRYRAHFHLTEIRLAQLLLTLEETEQYLRDVSNVALSEESIEQLYQQTEGWITGLHLTALALRASEHLPPALSKRLATEASIDFLADELLAHQSEDVQRQLWQLAIPERINAELGWHLLNTQDNPIDADRLLRKLEANGYFLSALGEDRIWYRFHPLFRESLLKSSEQQLGEAGIRQANRRAAQWFEVNRHFDQAVRHFLAAGESAHAARLVENHAQLALATDNWQRLEWWLKQLPRDLRNQSAELTLASLWIDQIRGAYGKFPAGIAHVRALVQEHEDTWTEDDRKALESEAELLEAAFAPSNLFPTNLLEIGLRSWNILRARDRAGSSIALYCVMVSYVMSNRWAEAFDFLEQCVAQESEHVNDFSLVRDIWARTLLGLSKLLHGELDEAHDLGGQVLAMATNAGLHRLAAQGHFVVGCVDYERNDLDAAFNHFSTCFDEPLTGMVFRGECAHQLARTAALLGNEQTATDTLERMFDIHQSVESIGQPGSVRAMEADIAHMNGDVRKASAWAASTRVNPQIPSMLSVTITELIVARILISEEPLSDHRLTDLESLVGALAQRLENRHVHRIWIAVHALRAVVLDLKGEGEQALDILSDIVVRAEGHVRAFLDQGPALINLLERLAERNGADGPLGVLLDAAQREPRFQNGFNALDAPRGFPGQSNAYAATIESLSQREQEILRFLADRWSNKEIAEALGISPHTVKRHTISIYAKLGVRNRRQAVQAAEGNC